MRSLSLTPTWRRRHSTLSTPSAFRVEVRPPSLRHAPASLGQRLMFWLMAPAPQDAAPPINRLPGVKQDFLACLDDVPLAAAEGVRAAIDGARSLRELWHLRADLYGLVGRMHSENVAEERLARLNRHFPTRAPRPGAPAHSRPVLESRTVFATLLHLR
ncbi:MAG: hypothetical protein LC119_04200 [Burkholderiales bacterium]|nr:hypothetical protein [Burkholderiales bacterium]